MKLNKYFSLSSAGFAYHVILPVIAVLVVVGIGAKVLTASHAATPNYYQVLNSANAAQTTGVSQIAAQVQSLGSQTVSELAPGAQLDYLVYGKVPITSECYFIQVLPLKGGSTTANITFGGIGATKSVNVTYNANYSNYLQRFCVPTNATGATPAYNVYNQSPSTGPDVLVFEDVVEQPGQ